MPFQTCRRSKSSRSLAAIFLVCTLASYIITGDVASVSAQTKQFKQFDAPHVFRQLDDLSASVPQQLTESWWDQHVTSPLRSQQPLPTDLHTLLYLALQHSNNIKIAKRDPLIRETAIVEADSNFDWVRFLDASWNDFSEPVGNQLTAGGTATRFDEQTFSGTAGVRRLTRYGGLLNISQQFGWQDNNSIFLVPDQQATSRLSVSYTQPLLRGRGRAFNENLVFLARLDNEVAQQEFLATLQDELLEITRSYWSLYLERAALAQQMRLFLRTQEIYETLHARQGIDTQKTQLILASSALENRRADLIRARTAVTNAETRLRGLINAPQLANADVAELVPVEAPTILDYGVDFQAELQTAAQSRPEIQAAIRQVKSGSIRLGVAQHELLPTLNLVTEAFVNGLQGDSDFGQSFADQFTDGRPSYTVGLQYELPVGNRLARARLCRRKQELEQLHDEYARAFETVRTEVDIAVREVKTAYQEIVAKSRALVAAEAEAATIEQRWKTMVDGNGSVGLNLESLLRAQERVLAAENEYVDSILTYNLSTVNLKRANGTLLQSENVTATEVVEGGCKDIQLDKGGSEIMIAETQPEDTTTVPILAPDQVAPPQFIPVNPSVDFPDHVAPPRASTTNGSATR